jgi:hypothetical protein
VTQPSPQPSLITWLSAHVEVVVALIGAGALWLRTQVSGKAGIQTAINDGFEKLLAQVTAAHEEERNAWLAKQEHLENSIKELTIAVRALVASLNQHGIPLPPLKLPSFITLE